MIDLKSDWTWPAPPWNWSDLKLAFKVAWTDHEIHLNLKLTWTWSGPLLRGILYDQNELAVWRLMSCTWGNKLEINFHEFALTSTRRISTRRLNLLSSYTIIIYMEHKHIPFPLFSSRCGESEKAIQRTLNIFNERHKYGINETFSSSEKYFGLGLNGKNFIDKKETK